MESAQLKDNGLWRQTTLGLVFNASELVINLYFRYIVFQIKKIAVV